MWALGRVKFRKQTVLSYWSGHISTQELVEEVLKSDWTIETTKEKLLANHLFQYTEFLKCQMLDKRVQQDGERVFIVLD